MCVRARARVQACVCACVCVSEVPCPPSLGFLICSPRENNPHRTAWWRDKHRSAWEGQGVTATLRPHPARTPAVHCDGEALLKVPGKPIYFLNQTCNENPDGKE